jgi:hypothetical protein
MADLPSLKDLGNNKFLKNIPEFENLLIVPPI